MTESRSAQNGTTELHAGSQAYEAMRSARDQYLARCDQLVVRAQRYETALRLLIADVGLGNATVETVRAVSDALDQQQRVPERSSEED